MPFKQTVNNERSQEADWNNNNYKSSSLRVDVNDGRSKNCARIGQHTPFAMRCR